MDEILNIHYVRKEDDDISSNACVIDGYDFKRVRDTPVFQYEERISHESLPIHLRCDFDAFNNAMSFVLSLKTKEVNPNYLQFLLDSASGPDVLEFSRIFEEFGEYPVLDVSSDTQQLERYLKDIRKKIKERTEDLIDSSEKNVALKKKKAIQAYNEYHRVTRW